MFNRVLKICYANELTTAVFEWQISTDDGSIISVIASDPKIDVMPIRFDPSKALFMDFQTKEYLAVGFFSDKLKWEVLHPR